MDDMDCTCGMNDVPHLAGCFAIRIGGGIKLGWCGGVLRHRPHYTQNIENADTGWCEGLGLEPFESSADVEAFLNS